VFGLRMEDTQIDIKIYSSEQKQLSLLSTYLHYTTKPRQKRKNKKVSVVTKSCAHRQKATIVRGPTK
jgi:hypothetical protein